MTTRAANHLWPRIILAGPWTLIAAVVMMAAMATWLPPGEAQVDNMMLPLVLFPLIWAAFFFAACLDRNLLRAIAISVGITVVNALLLVRHFMG